MLTKSTYNLFLSLLIGLVFVAWPFMPIQASTSTLDGLNQTAKQVDAFKNLTGGTYDNFLQTRTGEIIGTILSFVGVLFLGLMMYAGILWMTAQGNEQQITKAKGMLTNAIIGIIVVFAAYAITTFIGTQVLQ